MMETVGNPLASTSATPIRVLVADDDPTILRCYRRAFARPPETAGQAALDSLSGELFGPQTGPGQSAVFELVECRQGDEAVEAAAHACRSEMPFDVVVLDVRMPPGINGIEAGERIRRFAPDVPFVFVTGYSDVSQGDLERRVPPASKLHFYNKPLSFSALARDIAEIVRPARTG